jgi:hypothetical protein
VSIYGGKLTITAGADGIQAESKVLIGGGDLTILSGGGSTRTVSASSSAKAIKADVDLTIEGGTINVDSSDDALHSNDSLTIKGGNITLATADDGIHADTAITIDGGDIDITKCYEGIESAVITINDGNIHVVSSDDGINIASGTGGGMIGGRPGQTPFISNSNDHLDINGGYIAINSGGDGFDVNGSVNMTGGTLIIHGPTVSMNGALDYDGTFLMTGGYLLAVGSSGMAQVPSASSTQETLGLVYRYAQAAGTMLHVEAEDGTDILTFVPVKAYQCVVLCAPQLKVGTTYDVYSGGISTGTVADGLYSGGTYTAGTKLGSIALS